MERRSRRTIALVWGVAAALALVSLTPTARAEDGEDDRGLAWVGEKEARARELVRQGSEERTAYLESGDAGPRAYEATFAEAAALLTEVVAAAPTPKRLYGLAYSRFHSNQVELAHFACDRLARDYPAEETIRQRCEALTAALHEIVFRVLISSEPSGAFVGVEGWPAGEGVLTPGVLWLRAGERRLVFRLEDHVELVQKVNVEAGFVGQVVARLQPVPRAGRIELVVDPPEADVRIDGEPVELPAGGILDLAPGEHALRVTLDGFRTHEETVRIAMGETESRWVTLVRATPAGGGSGPDGPGVIEPPAPVDRTRGFAPWGWTAVGVGGACLVGGGVLHGLAAVDADDASGVPNLPGRRGDYAAKRDAAREKEMVAYILYGAGAALVATGVVLLVLDDVPDEGSGTVVPTAYPGGGGITWVTRF